MNERDAAGVAGAFSEDGNWGAVVGREAIRAACEAGFGTALAHIERLATAPGSIHIEFDGDTATGFVQGLATLVIRRSDGSKRVSVTDALYYLQWRREPEGWRISSMTGKQAPELPHDASFQFNVPMATIDHGMDPDV